MENLPTLGEFRVALQEDTAFRDYLNTYLRLPVFSRRLTYCAQKETWIVEPSFVATYYFTEDEAILAWVHEKRLPLFWDTDLFYEYRLARKLVENNEVLDSTLRDALLTVYGMERFRYFLFATEGDSSCIFWMEVERLKRTSDDPAARNKILAKINSTFLNDGASFSLKQEVKQIILSFKRSGCSTDSESHFAVRMKALSHVQLSALHSLRTYWTKRYMDSMVVHSTPCRVRRMSNACADVQFTPKSQFLPKIITAHDAMRDSRQPKAAPELFTVSQQRLLPAMSCGRFGTATTSLNAARGDVQKVQKVETITKNSLADGTGSGDQLRPMFTTSAQLLFPKLTPSESVRTTASPSGSSSDGRLRSLLCATIRADFVAGNPLLRYLSACSSRESQDHLLFWWSVELVLTQDEMERYYQARVPATDCPYLTSFETQPVAQTMSELLVLFVEEGARHPVSLPQPLLNGLGTCLRKGMGRSLLLYAQEHVIEKLLPVWKQYLLHDNNDFVKSCVAERVLCGQPLSYRDRVRTSLSTTTLEEVPLFIFSSGDMEPVWRSLKLSEAAKYPGVSHLPSRQWQGVAVTAPCPLIVDTPAAPRSGLPTLNDATLEAKLAEMVSNPTITTIFRAHRQDARKSRHVLLCVTKPANILGLKRPPHPRGYMDILKDPKQLRFFEHFLSTKGNNSEARLQFWLAVEDLKSIHKKSTLRHQIAKIEQRFLGRKAEKLVGYQVAEFLGSERLTLAKLLTAQAMISDHMEGTWYKPYLEYLRVDEEQEKPASIVTVQEPVENTKRTFHCKERTKILWTTFAHLVVNFRRGLMNQATAEQFHLFLRKEVTRGVISRDGTKIMVGKKMVMVTKLLNDLSFWAEVERYKDIFDMLSASKISGYHVPEDDIIIHKKVTAIVNCYIDSVVIPKVQINTSAEIAERIIRNVAQGHITRGLFHEAALSIFSILTVYWKKFCLAKFSTPQKPSWSKLAMDRLALEDSKAILNFTIGIPNCYSLTSFEHSTSQLFGKATPQSSTLHPPLQDPLSNAPPPSPPHLDGPILSFSLHHGLRWYKTRANNQAGIDLQNPTTVSS